MKILIYIFLIPFLLVKLILWAVATLFILIWGPLAVICNSHSVSDIQSIIQNLWDAYPPKVQ